MRMTKLLLAGASLLPFCALSQINESFADGDFTQNPTWLGNVDSWMINSNQQLQSNNTTANSSFYLSTANALATAAQWEFNVQLNFNTSSANYVDVFLTASASDLTNSATTGYFVRIGNTEDEISLYRKDANGTSIRLIDGTDGITNSTSNKLKIKVVRDAGNQFTLFRDAGNSGSFTLEGTATDATYTSSVYFGFLVKQSTSSFFQKHFFDDILVQPYPPAINPPVTSIYLPQRFDVLIDEIMADPSPQVGLPNAEYIELKNASGKDINLKGWKIVTATSSSSAFADYLLPADSFLIITSTGNAAAFSPFGKVLGVGSFPALTNDGAILSLFSKENKTIHAVSYTADWYQNVVKKEGGWSLEMIDTHNPCSGISNWKASTNNLGGTPGKKNSVDAVNKDETAPEMKQAYVVDAFSLMLSFNEPVDSVSSSVSNHYTLSPEIVVQSALALAPDFSQVQLKLSPPLQPSVLYTLSASGLTDCAGNEIDPSYKILTGLPQESLSNDVVINEILFNPKPSEADYVELYNRSQKIIDVSQLYLANRNSSGVVSSLKKLSDKPWYLFPNDYVTITEDAASVQRNYLVKNPNALLTLSSLPSFPDKEGTVVLLNLQGTVLDEVHYNEDWHFALLANAEGVSLERIDPGAASQDKNNWHSAASTAGYGTPTYKNSQYKQTENLDAVISITPKIFSPDNDGFEDVATISYQLAESGFVANITIFDAAGRFIKQLVKNDILGLKGSWNWDGLDEKGQKLAAGPYIVYTEIFNLKGKKKQFKNVVVLARKN